MSALESPLAEPPVADPGTELMPGYTIVAHMSRGRLLDVYDVVSHERDCRCVLKLLRPDQIDSSAGCERLLNEGRILLQLTHPHIVRAYELREEPQPALILEPLPGMTLEYGLRQEGPGQPDFLVKLGRHLTSAIRYVHRRGFVHCDLKPGNIILTLGLARLIDFSLARPPGRGGAGTGTHAYLAPEQARGEELDAATDVWGIGVVLWEAATGEPPFRRPQDDPERYEQLERRAALLGDICELPPSLAELVDACLEPDPRDRPTTDALAAELDLVLAPSP